MSFNEINLILLSVPPRILLDRTSTDVVVREGTEVTLECSAVGYPEPYVAWRREDGKAINYNGELGEKMLDLFGNQIIRGEISVNFFICM
jgi:Immunoglobulin I-set domain.